MGAIERAEPHEPLAAHHRWDFGGPKGPDHPHHAQLASVAILGIIAGLATILGGIVWWIGPPTFGPGYGPSSGGYGPWLLGAGVVAGAGVVVLSAGLMRWPEHHPSLGVGIIVASGLTLLAGPLLWVGLVLGLVAGPLAIAVGSPASPKLYYYTPFHLSVPMASPPPSFVGPGAVFAVPQAAPAAAVPNVPAGRSCVRCARSVSAAAEYCPWCGSSQTARPR